MALPDIVELTKAVQKRVCRGRDRYYTYFGCTPFIGGMSRGFTCGCNFRCSMCLSPFREFVNGETRFILPSLYKDISETAGFYSPEEVIDICIKNEKGRKIDEIALFDGVVPRRSKFPYLDVGYAEIAIGKEHLLGLCKATAPTGYIFVVETNGWLIGYDDEYAKELAKYKDTILVRVGVKAASEEYCEKIIGCRNVKDYVFRGIKNLIDNGIVPDVAMMCDRRFYPQSEIDLMVKKIRDAGYENEITEEKAFSYYTAYKRWVERGNDPKVWAKNGKLEISGKRILGTYFIERFNGDHLLLPGKKDKAQRLSRHFEKMLKDFDISHARRLKGVIEFSIDDKFGGTWSFIFDGNSCMLQRGVVGNPLIRYIMDLESAYECFIEGTLDFAHALFQNRVRIEGNHNLLYDVALSFNLFDCNSKEECKSKSSGQEIEIHSAINTSQQLGAAL